MHESCVYLFASKISFLLHSFDVRRITIPEIRNHEWFLKNLPADLMDENMTSNRFQEPDQPVQSDDEIMKIITEATIPAAGTNSRNQYFLVAWTLNTIWRKISRMILMLTFMCNVIIRCNGTQNQISKTEL